jgi:hypothetical protein
MVVSSWRSASLAASDEKSAMAISWNDCRLSPGERMNRDGRPML